MAAKLQQALLVAELVWKAAGNHESVAKFLPASRFICEMRL